MFSTFRSRRTGVGINFVHVCEQIVKRRHGGLVIDEEIRIGNGGFELRYVVCILKVGVEDLRCHVAGGTLFN